MHPHHVTSSFSKIKEDRTDSAVQKTVRTADLREWIVMVMVGLEVDCSTWREEGGVDGGGVNDRETMCECV